MAAVELSANVKNENFDSVIPPTASLRRAHSLVNQNHKKEQSLDRQQKKLNPAGSGAKFAMQNNCVGRQGNKNNNQNDKRDQQDNKGHDREQKDNRGQDRRQKDSRRQDRGQKDSKGQARGQKDSNHQVNQARAPLRKPFGKQESENAEEDWDSGKVFTEKQAPQKPTTSVEAPQDTPVNKLPAKNLESAKPQPVNPVKSPPSKFLASINDVTPSRKMVPKNYVVELLPVGDMVILTVDNKASECCSQSSGFVCVAFHQKYEKDYQALCEDYVLDCIADTAEYTVSPGEIFSYLNPDDDAWYRARCLNPSLAALLDCGKVFPLNNTVNVKQLVDKYKSIPEFCCLLEADNLQVGDNIKCTILSKSVKGCRVSIENVETGAVLGEGNISRWLPDVDYSPRVSRPVSTNAAPAVPKVPRPDVENNSKVVILEAEDLKNVIIRRADVASQRLYDAVIYAVLLYGRTATSLTEPPKKGQMVVGKFSDGLYYRALCLRTNVKQDKYLLEYIEFGNREVTKLENIYPCPAEFDLSAFPTVAAMVSLQTNVTTLTPAATKYIKKLKDSTVELILTVPGGAKTAPSGTEVQLTIADNRESVNVKLEEMCTPEWKKMELKGADVVDLKPLMYKDLDYVEIPLSCNELHVFDISSLETGNIGGCKLDEPLLQLIHEGLQKRLEEYCTSEIGREPYLPTFEELCIAQYLPDKQWLRAVLLEQINGAGGDLVRVCYVDYGNVESVPVGALRKMLPEFVRDLPAVAAHFEIRDFPKEPTQEMLVHAIQHMKINEEGQGVLRVQRMEKLDKGMYAVHAPELIAAMTQNL